MLRSEQAPDRAAYVRELKAKARAKKLAHAEQWLRLGHWRRTWSGSYESEADGDNFFLSPHGKKHPQLELDATLAGFFSELAPFDPELVANKNIQHPICQFPARLAWLSQQLGIDRSRLPQADCSRFDEFRTSLQAESVTMVFSSYFLNNPASAFGHTFLRVNKKNEMVPEERRQLLDFGIDFSADPDTNFAPLYAIKGLAGAFPGTFRKIPYYFKVRQYNDFESRDLWEYKLALTPAQLELLIAHVWELGSTFFDYFYLTENCSYHILALVEVAAERSLLEHVHWPVIPADSIKALFEAEGLVAETTFRPSIRTRFREQTRSLTDEQADAVVQLSDDPKAALAAWAPAQTIRVLDAAQDLVDIRFAKEIVKGPRESEAAKRKQALLERRAEILVPSPEIRETIPWSKMPQRGHDSRRLSLGGGANTNGEGYVSVGARLALHDLADPTSGYPELSQLEFLPTRARYDVVDRDFTLEQLDLVHIVSLTSQNRFSRHTSWEFRIGSQRLIDEGCNCYAGHVQFGGGIAFGNESESATLFLLAQSHVWAGRELDGLFGAPVRFGIGPSGGVRLRLAPRLVALVLGEWDWLPGQTGFHTWYGSANLRWAVARNVAFDLEGRGGNNGGRAGEELVSGSLSTMLYF